jgi:hypothetical protein
VISTIPPISTKQTIISKQWCYTYDTYDTLIIHVYICSVVGYPVSKGGGGSGGGSELTGLTLQQFCTCPKPGSGFVVVPTFFLVYSARGWMWVDCLFWLKFIH